MLKENINIKRSVSMFKKKWSFVLGYVMGSVGDLNKVYPHPRTCKCDLFVKRVFADEMKFWILR